MPSQSRIEAVISKDNNKLSQWIKLLDVVGSHFEPAIAGGAIRDCMLGEEAKDIDIFVPCLTTEDFTSIIDQMAPSAAHGRIIWLRDDGDTPEAYQSIANASDDANNDYANWDSGVVGVWEGEILGLPANIIGRVQLREGLLKLIQSFNYGICQIGYSEATGVMMTPAFQRHFENRTAMLGEMGADIDLIARGLRGGRWAFLRQVARAAQGS
jgi:hypothetical protein